MNKLLNGKIKIFDFGPRTSANSLYIQGQLHSNEVNAFSTLIYLTELLANNPPQVSVRVIPCCNHIGWDSYLYGNSGRVSYPGYNDWNRIFEIIPKTDGTLEKELATTLWGLSKGFDNIIDVHTPEFGYPHVYTTNINKRLLTFDNLPYVISDNNTASAFEDLNARERKISSCTLELPNFEVWTLTHQKYWANRIYKEILAHQNSIPPKQNKKPKYVGKIISLYSKISGVPVLIATPNKICRKGEPIVKIISREGKSETLFFGFDCIPLCFIRRGIILSGHWVVRVLLLS